MLAVFFVLLVVIFSSLAQERSEGYVFMLYRIPPNSDGLLLQDVSLDPSGCNVPCPVSRADLSDAEKSELHVTRCPSSLAKPVQLFKRNTPYCGYEMDLLQVFDADGNLVLPPKHRDIIPEGTLVIVRGSIKM